MPRELPVACSLGEDDIVERLAAMRSLGAAGLVDRRERGRGHLLRFRADERTRAELARIVAAERECCPFLDLSLSEGDGLLTLSIEAPDGGEATAAGLAMAFAADAK